jgi:hypothetical protein
MTLHASKTIEICDAFDGPGLAKSGFTFSEQRFRFQESEFLASIKRTHTGLQHIKHLKPN